AGRRGSQDSESGADAAPPHARRPGEMAAVQALSGPPDGRPRRTVARTGINHHPAELENSSTA
ncbi:MAG: hypothetical protein WBA50_02745, partial [Mycobacterium sp.]